MPIKIHHGPNGSYKTSGAVWDDAVMAMKEGRVIITNIRGMNTERCYEVFPDLPDSFEVIHLNTETADGLEKARTWFQWAPRGAFLIFDEPQTIFLKKWTDKYLERFDFPGGPDAAEAADRPVDFLDAWTRQRHWNWDVVLCTPNIRYLRDDIRMTCEMAYLHTNFAVLGKALKAIFGDYKEVMHSAQDNKPSADGKNIVKFKKIDKRVYKLYDSTATGQHRDTFTGQNLLASPKVVLPLGFLAIVLAVMYQRTGFALATDGLGHKPAEASVSAPAAPAGPAPAARADVATDDDRDTVRSGSAAEAGSLGGPYGKAQLTIKGCMMSERKGVKCLYWAKTGSMRFTLSTADLLVAGYEIRSFGLCAAEITYKGTKQNVICDGEGQNGRADERHAKRGGEAVTASPHEPSQTRVTVVNSGKPGHLW